MTQIMKPEDAWSTVRIPSELVSAVERAVRRLKDEFGVPLFRSRSDFITEATRHYLQKHKEAMPG